MNLADSRLPGTLARQLRSGEPLLWLNDSRRPEGPTLAATGINPDLVHEAEHRLRRFGTLMAELFPELQAAGGIVESPLHPVPSLEQLLGGNVRDGGQWFVKCDHALPIAGSIKARGGFYEVLTHAEALALKTGLLKPGDNPQCLATPELRSLFARHHIAVGSTGNLGLSIGLIASALGFRTTVHMSADAKLWKKARLRASGVEVVEHTGDYSAAVAAGRRDSQADPSSYFVDDENSIPLFAGYSAAAIRLAQQLKALAVRVDARHPLFVYLPCGVGGAPGGITFGLRHLLGEHVHCFFAEPIAAPCMLMRLAVLDDRPISIRDIGLSERTEADGLAVGQASELAAAAMKPLVSGVFTVSDEDLHRGLYRLEQMEELRVEPSAAAAVSGPCWILESEAGRGYLARHGMAQLTSSSTHVIWTTGGALLPAEEYRVMYERGRKLSMARARRD
jgi:D-serine dehydratase